MEEVWLPVKDFQDYQVSNLGRVKSLKQGKGANSKDGILKQSKQKYEDYERCYVILYIEGKPYTKAVHRLVADAFLFNSENYPIIDHINRDATDNRVENLRWTSYSENNLNRRNMFRETNTGEPYITFIPKRNRYLVQKTIKYIKHTYWCHTLQQAIEYRDNLLNN